MSARGVGPWLFGLLTNLVLIWGVVYGGWAPGNVWLAFLLESVTLWLLTTFRLRRFGTRKGSMDASFFFPWYGIFTLVQAVFAIITAVLSGVVPDLTLWVPVALVLARAAAEAVDIASAARTGRTRPVLTPVITRMIVLHVGVILGFAAALSAGGRSGQPVDVLGVTVPAAALSVVILMAIKTLAEIGVGLVLGVRALARRPNAA